MKIPEPFKTFHLEVAAGGYKDFGTSNNSYPLQGVTYPVDYGDIKGYIAEDGVNLDVFMGKDGELCGFIKVFRPELVDGEHKFFVNVTNKQEAQILEAFQPVLLAHGRYATDEQLMTAIKPFKVANP